MPTPVAPQIPSKHMKESKHDSHQSPSDQFKAATIPSLKVIFTQEQVEQMLKIASEGVKVTFEKV